MPRGRHRHSPSLHRLLPPAAVAAAGLACAGGAWLAGPPGVSDSGTVVLRGLVAAAALAAVTGAALARNWDRGAGRRVGELKARLAGQEWRAEERQAELEADLEESREQRDGLETALRDKRAELARLRTEHAALLRRYAEAESGRASALERRRLLEIEASEPARALTAGVTDHRSASGAPTPLTYLQANEALKHLRRNAERQRETAGPAAGAQASPVPAGGGSGRRKRPAGGFDYFGTGTAAAAGRPAAGAEQEARQPAAQQAKPEAEREAEPKAEAESAPEPEAAVLPTARRPDYGPAGDVVDLAKGDPARGAGAKTDSTSGRDAAPGPLDITELRDAVS